MPKERREYLLPSGCKDLIDGLKSNAKKVGIRPGGKKSKFKVKPLPSVFLSNTVVVKESASALGIKLYRLIDFLKEMKVFTSVSQRSPFTWQPKSQNISDFSRERKPTNVVRHEANLPFK